MNSMCFRALVAALGILVSGQCWGQQVSLSFVGDACDGEITGAPGSVQSVSLGCRLTTTNAGNRGGAQGWSISLAAEGGTITGITTDGTAAAMEADGGLRGGGFEKSETTSESGVATGGNNDCEGLNGAVSAIVLSFESPVTLDAEGSAVIARIDVEAAAPDSHGDCNGVEVFFADGCRGAGQPVRNAITLDTRTFIPALGRCDFNVCSLPPEDCASEGDEDQNGLADCEDPA